jgi:membrane fusion protein, heavy metal efflux system
MYKTVFIFILAVISSCHNSGDNGPERRKGNNSQQHIEDQRKRIRGHRTPDENVSISFSGDTVIVPAGSAVNQKLSILKISTRDYNSELITTGIVKPLAGHLAHVSTPFDGRIVRSFVRLGEKVRDGAPLFEVNSSDYLESVRIFIQAGNQKELAKKNWLRKKELLESGISSSREYDEAKLEFDLAEKEFEKTAAILKIYGIGQDEADMAKPLIVRSPISGEIVHTDITVGQYLKSDSEPIVTVADLERIWVIARIKEKDLGIINLKDRVEVITESSPDKPINGAVSYIGNIMDEQTRSVEVYIECENHEKILKPGMFITTRFYHQMTKAVLIPATSLMQEENKSFVFLKIGPTEYLKRTVISETAGERQAYIKSGLSEGDSIVSDGAIYLR